MERITSKAVSIIEHYFGVQTAHMYSQFYEDKDEQLIKNSVSELLSEALGVKKAEQVIAQEFKDINHS